MKNKKSALKNYALTFSFSLCFIFTALHSTAQWTGASSGLPTTGPSAKFTAMCESSSAMYIGSLSGDLYYNDFSTGLTKTWSLITKPSGASSPITNICAVGSSLYVNWNNEIYLSNNNGVTWTLIASNFEALPSSSYYLGFNNQMFASDGSYFWYIKQSTGAIYQGTVGSTPAHGLPSIP